MGRRAFLSPTAMRKSKSGSTCAPSRRQNTTTTCSSMFPHRTTSIWSGWPTGLPFGSTDSRNTGDFRRSGFEQGPARRPKFLQLRCRFRFKVTADQWLRAARPEGDPLAIRQQKLVAVGRDELFHFERPDGIEAGGQLVQQGFLLLRRYSHVQPVAVKFAGLFFQLLQNPAEGFPFGCDQFGH